MKKIASTFYLITLQCLMMYIHQFYHFNGIKSDFTVLAFSLAIHLFHSGYMHGTGTGMVVIIKSVDKI